MLSVTCDFLLATCYLLCATCYLLLATCDLRRVICYLLLSTCYLLLATCYLLLTFSFASRMDATNPRSGPLLLVYSVYIYILETRHGPDDASRTLQGMRGKLVDGLSVGAVVGTWALRPGRRGQTISLSTSLHRKACNDVLASSGPCLVSSI